MRYGVQVALELPPFKSVIPAWLLAAERDADPEGSSTSIPLLLLAPAPALLLLLLLLELLLELELLKAAEEEDAEASVFLKAYLGRTSGWLLLLLALAEEEDAELAPGTIEPPASASFAIISRSATFSAWPPISDRWMPSAEGKATKLAVLMKRGR